MRRLSAHERALWARVAASVKPLPGKRAPEMPVAAIAVPAAPAAPKAKPPSRPAPTSALAKPAVPPPKVAKPHPLGAPLDGTWDRQISRGRLFPDRVIDLHGHTVVDAHATLSSAILANDGTRVILVVTGKGRPDRPARIRAELMHWLERPDLRSQVASLRAAHPRHGGGGAFYIILRRAK
ncbi:Smr/MutS family protein [Sandarakinorhabdus sp.]|uniref:Smr/MutS family protein n=1 Tax=Sandarakinorhabdus sp. TaxID=1916663 RepID=UPI00286E6BF7|nr:Smr/MutS family protein [Sandarakinorhabdus sp.]